MGNRIYGCDDCQLICPWNKFAGVTAENDFAVRNGLDDVGLVELFGWTQAQFDQRLEGSPIRRIGHERWLRNIAVALGNAIAKSSCDAAAAKVVDALERRKAHPSALVREHVTWALAQAPKSIKPIK